MDVARFLRALKSTRDYQGQLVSVKTFPPREACYASPSEPVDPRVGELLARTGVGRLYSHQAAALDELRKGLDIVVVTGTASGKTLCYNVPVIEAITRDPRTCALYLFPTKALAQDQLRGLLRYRELDPSLPLVAGTYDGDTPPSARRKLRDEGNLVLTNPDMLHQGILPRHPGWGRFFQNLAFVVVDEIHAYRGVFGSNVACVMRRLERVCEHYGSRPRFVCASATIANPKELAERLTGRQVTVIDNDGSPRGKRTFALWNPPFVDAAHVQRRSSNSEATRIFVELVKDRVQAIAFVKARVVAELLHRYAQEALERDSPSLARRVAPYRAGYLPEDRRDIERRLFSGDLLGVAATNALELGIDVGGLDASVIVGYPGSVASTWQQAGRAGRGSEESLAVLVAYDAPIDQYLMRNPDYLFGKPVEQAVIDPANPYIAASHVRCAVFELPFTCRDQDRFGEFTGAMLELLAERREVRRIQNRWHWANPAFPSRDVRLRDASEDTYSILEVGSEDERDRPDKRDAPEDGPGGKGNRVIATMDGLSAFELIHPEAIYMHDGETYFVSDLDLEKKVAYVNRVDSDYFTQSVADTSISVERQETEKLWRKSRVSFGDVAVTSVVFMYKKIKFYSRDSIGYGRVSLPETTMATCAFWVVPPLATLRRVRELGRDPSEGLCGIGNAACAVIPLYAMCDPMDIGAVVDSRNTGSPTLFVYDRYAGGAGFAQKTFELVEDIMRASLDLVAGCGCEDGCPSCVGAPPPPYAQRDPDLVAMGRIPDKEAALMILHDLLELDPYVPKPKPGAGPPGRLQGGAEVVEGAGGDGRGDRDGDRDGRGDRDGDGAGEPPDAQAHILVTRRLPENVEARLRKQLGRIAGRPRGGDSARR